MRFTEMFEEYLTMKAKAEALNKNSRTFDIIVQTRIKRKKSI